MRSRILKGNVKHFLSVVNVFSISVFMKLKRRDNLVKRLKVFNREFHLSK